MSDNAESRARLVVKQLSGFAEAFKALDTALGESTDLGKLIAAKQATLDEMKRQEAAIGSKLEAASSEAAKLIKAAQDKAAAHVSESAKAQQEAAGKIAQARAQADRLIADALVGIAAAERESAQKLADLKREVDDTGLRVDRLRSDANEATAALAATLSRKSEVEAEISRLKSLFAGR